MINNKIIYSIVMLLMGLQMQAQVVLSDKNYVHTTVPQTAVTITDMENVSCANANDVDNTIESVTYYDGLGRPIQQRAIKASPTGKDIVTHMQYDAYGRQAKQYLPFEANNTVGSYKTVDVNIDINAYYKNTYSDDFPGITTNLGDVNAYSESVFEASPLNRVTEQGAPGKAWKADPNSDTDHTIKFDWGTNASNEVVNFTVSFTGGDTQKPELAQNNHYTPNQLYVTITKDENWTPSDGDLHTTKEYKDKQGRVVLKRTYASTPSSTSEAHDTYYVYDSYGNLTYVIPPKVNTTDGVSNTELVEVCYQYTYDYRNRLIEKKIPGKGWEYIIYNKLDQPVLTQDALQKQDNLWLFTKYDALGRVTYTGKYTDSRDRGAIQTTVNAATSLWEERGAEAMLDGTAIYYSNTAFPNTNLELLTISYYDDYDVGDAVGFHPSTSSGPWEGMNVVVYPKGSQTVSRVRVLDTNQWINTVSYYDEKGRLWETNVNNQYLGTDDWVLTKLDFTGKPLKTFTKHIRNGVLTCTTDLFTYDHMGRLLTQTQQINTQDTEQIVSNTYDALGQLESKAVGGVANASEATSPLQEVNYKYNVRGWLTGINDVNTLGNDLFAFGINYNTTTEGLGATPLYNGNISETLWKTANDNTKRAYGYQYDELNRIVEGRSNDGNYNLSNISYDKMGNILTLNRTGHINEAVTFFGVMDNLGYTYDAGNKLVKVTDTANKIFGFKDGTNTNDDFTYDDNGNMVTDQNKGITGITYNHLNLPKTVSISNAQGTGNITYIYDATGAKLKKIAPSGSSLIETEYAGNHIYKNGNLEYFSTPEGYATPEGTGYRYVYQFKDHLDNVRLSYTKNDTGNLEIIEENNYYPFGLTHKGYNSTVSSLGNSTAQLLKFGGKEEQNELGLVWIDITARNYDPALGRWMNLDPLAEKMRRHSPYNYGFDNPIYFMDPDGMAPFGFEEGPIRDKNGKIVAYEVEAGQGPSQIAEDLNSTGEFNVEANYFDIVESNPTKFSNVENLSDINDPEFRKLNLNEGDKINIDKVLDKESIAQEKISERRELASDVNDTRKSIDKANKDIDSLVEVKKTAIERHELNKSAKAHESHPSDPSAAGALSEIGGALRHGLIEMNSNKMIKEKKRDIDSMKALNNERLNKMKKLDN
ncbi:DUF6443 domain-containing protein [Aquimarina algiphila]|uniref:Type IV secretion protein Rhs n=1 Tax=Aquimarina algiphila TaxID=2047982 RepID=A0A554VA95_9FLAO|nr:DUF6443 domain-containing protein [Aquimarina algiphila]TSE02878.1 type IV secretion protein Rhs [Aquimarina algiphila]